MNKWSGIIVMVRRPGRHCRTSKGGGIWADEKKREEKTEKEDQERGK